MDYEYVNYHYRIIAVDLGRQKELDADPKAIQQIESGDQLNNSDNNNNNAAEADGGQSTFVFNNFRKNQRNSTKFLLRECNSLIKDGKL